MLTIRRISIVTGPFSIFSCTNFNRPETIATFDGSISNLKVAHIDSDTIALAVTGLATPNGDLYNEEKATKPHSTGKVYTRLFVRQWDAYVTENKNSIWYTTLKKSKGVVAKSTSPLRNALRGHSVQLESPVPPFGGTEDFDISRYGLVVSFRTLPLDDPLLGSVKGKSYSS
jgi:hypothetical protein